ncbi:MAG: hypothetical protein IRY89_01770 [Pseudolabrys sp.]|nr:hypothetical protein [Pseudolabrys sp.]
MTAAALAAMLPVPCGAASYPVSGAWGVSTSSAPGAVDCRNRRTIVFTGDRRHDSNGGAPDYRNVSVQAAGPSRYRIVDTFANALVSNPHTEFTLTQIDTDHIVLEMYGTTLALQRCK